MRSLEPIPKGGIRAVHGDIEDSFRFNEQVIIDYESLSGTKYRTIVTMSADKTMQTKFERPGAKLNGS